MTLKFGDEQDIARARRKPSSKRWVDVRGPFPRHGHKCGDCKHLTRNRVAYKCGQSTITAGPGTDIRLCHPACILWAKNNA